MTQPNKDNQKDTALRPRESDDGPPESPPPYICADTGPPPAVTLARQRPRRVAMLNFAQPAEGFRYLDSMRWFAVDLRFFNRQSNVLKTVVVGLHRTIKCERRSNEVSRKPAYTDQTMMTLVPSPLDELGPGEIERAFGPCYDWPRDWEFTLSFICCSRTTDGRGWTACACLYINGLSPHGDLAIPWKDPFKTWSLGSDALPSRVKPKRSKKRRLKFSWQFIESTSPSRWGASIDVYYCDPRDAGKGSGNDGPPLGSHNPWAHIDRAVTYHAEMNRRVSLKSYKKVMFYNNKLGYGNDVLDQPVEAWRAEHKERYAEFASRFLPRGD